MKKNKEKSEDKKASKKDSQKVARKELETSLGNKFKEVIKSLGYEAELIAKDIEKAGKLLAKRLSDRNDKKGKESGKSKNKGKEVEVDKRKSSLIKQLDAAIEEVKAKNADAKPQQTKAQQTKARPTSKAGNTAVRAAAKATSVSAIGSRGRAANIQPAESKEITDSADKKVPNKRSPRKRTVAQPAEGKKELNTTNKSESSKDQITNPDGQA